MQNMLLPTLKRLWDLVGHAGRVKLLHEALSALFSAVTGSLAWLAGLGLIAIIIAVLVFFISSVAFYLRSSRKDSNSNASSGFVRDILIYTNSPDAPALFGATANRTLDKVTIFLDYSAYYMSLGHAGWSQRRRIKLASFNPFEKDMRYEATVVSRSVDTAKKTVELRNS
jgi:hypothetical protein